MATIRIPPVLRPSVGGEKELSAEGSSVGEILRSVADESPRDPVPAVRRRRRAQPLRQRLPQRRGRARARRPGHGRRRQRHAGDPARDGGRGGWPSPLRRTRARTCLPLDSGPPDDRPGRGRRTRRLTREGLRRPASRGSSVHHRREPNASSDQAGQPRRRPRSFVMALAVAGLAASRARRDRGRQVVHAEGHQERARHQHADEVVPSQGRRRTRVGRGRPDRLSRLHASRARPRTT